MSINILALGIKSPSVIEFLHPPLSRRDINSLFMPCLCPHLLHVQEINQIHCPDIFANRLQMCVKFLSKHLVFFEHGFIPCAIIIVGQMIVICNKCASASLDNPHVPWFFLKSSCSVS